DDGLARRLEGIASDDRAAGAIGAAADRYLGGVALHIADVFERDVEPLVHQLREHRRVPLAVRMRSGQHGERSAGIEAQIHAVVEDAAELDVVAHRPAAQLAVLLRGFLSRHKTLPVAELDALVHEALELSAVVVPQRGRRVWELARRDQVAAPDLSGIYADRPRRVFDQPLGEVSRLGTSGAAIGPALRGVGEQA